MTALTPDADQLGRFVRSMFTYATSGGVVSLRAFVDTAEEDVFAIQPVVLNGDLSPLIESAIALASKAAQAPKPVVFCPPLATFTGRKANEASLREGLSLSVECDTYPTRARETLTGCIGAPTFVVASGGEWTNPDTGEIEPKLHLHWRLREPTTTPADHQRLKRARTLACDLVRADATSKTAVHPMRWPGSWHRKREPRLAQIIEETETDIDLNAAIEELEGLAAMRGGGADTQHDARDHDTDRGGDPALSAADLLACAERIPNDVEWSEWNRIGMAFRRASAGSDAGYVAFNRWSSKHPKYSETTTRARWKHYFDSPPSEIGGGTLIRLARLADPAFTLEQSGGSPDDDRDRPRARVAITTTLSDVEPEPTRYLWFRYIPRGRLTLLEGDPGCGKSTLCATLAAVLTRGWALPDPVPVGLVAPPASPRPSSG